MCSPRVCVSLRCFWLRPFRRPSEGGHLPLDCTDHWIQCCTLAAFSVPTRDVISRFLEPLVNYIAWGCLLCGHGWDTSLTELSGRAVTLLHADSGAHHPCLSCLCHSLSPFPSISCLCRLMQETLEVGKLKAQVWDLGGQESIRPYWRSYFSHQEAVVFVVDSCDSARLDVARRELMAVLDEEELRTALVCVLANKQDRPEALPAAAIAEALSLTSIRDRKWTIISASALRGEGLKEGFQWIASELDNKA